MTTFTFSLLVIAICFMATTTKAQFFPPGGSTSGYSPGDSGESSYYPPSGSGSAESNSMSSGSFLPPPGSGSSQPDYHSSSSGPLSSGSWSGSSQWSSSGSSGSGSKTPTPPPTPTVPPSIIRTRGNATFVAATPVGIFYQCLSCFDFPNDGLLKSFVIDKQGNSIYHSTAIGPCIEATESSGFALCKSPTNTKVNSLINLSNGQTISSSSGSNNDNFYTSLLAASDMAIRGTLTCHSSSPSFDATFNATIQFEGLSLSTNTTTILASGTIMCTNSLMDLSCGPFMGVDVGCVNGTTTPITNYILTSRKKKSSITWTLAYPLHTGVSRGIWAIIFTQANTNGAYFKYGYPGPQLFVKGNTTIGQSDATIVVSTNTGKVYGFIDPQSQQQQQPNSKYSSSSLHHQVVVGGQVNSSITTALWTLNVRNQIQKYNPNLPAVFPEFPVISDDGFMFWSVSNLLLCIEPAFGQLYWREPFKAQSRSGTTAGADFLTAPLAVMSSSTSSSPTVLVASKDGLNIVNANEGSLIRVIPYPSNVVSLTEYQAVNFPMIVINKEIFISLDGGIFVSSIKND